MKCAHNHGEMKHFTYEGIAIDQCLICHSVWLDEGELPQIMCSREVTIGAELAKQVLTSAFKGMPHEEKETNIPCPVCKSTLTELNYSYNSGIIIDRCSKNHGIWLDGGELEKLQAHHEHWQSEVKNGKRDWMEIVKRIREEGHEKSTVITNKEFSPIFGFFMGQLGTKISKG